MIRSLHRAAAAACAGVLVAVVAASAAGAQSVPRIPFEKYTLANGMEVILHHDASVPLVTTNVWYKVGSGDEKPGRTGFAHLFEHVMFMGSQNVPVGMFDKWLEAVGAQNNGSTWFDRTNYFEWMPSNALPLALWLNADRMGYLLPTMDQAKLDLQRDVVKNERRQSYDNQPYGRAYETLLAAVFPNGHPYSWSTIGSMADLSAASLDDVKDFFRTYYAPNNATLVIAGDFNRDSTRAWVERYFGGIPRGPQMPERPVVPAVNIARDTFLVMQDKVQLPRFWYAWHGQRVFSADDAALDLLASVLASDKNSRLYRRLVYDTQMAQSVGASNESYKLDGFFHINVTPKPGQDPAALARMVDEEIRRVAESGITARELARVRNSHRTDFLDQLASVRNKADMLNYYNYVAGSPDFTQRDAARFDAVTVADIQRVARQYLLRPKVVLTVVPEGRNDMMLKGGSQ